LNEKINIQSKEINDLKKEIKKIPEFKEIIEKLKT